MVLNLIFCFLDFVFQARLSKKIFFTVFVKKILRQPWLRDRFAPLAKRSREHGPQAGHRRRLVRRWLPKNGNDPGRMRPRACVIFRKNRLS
ncbi:hypothetical protein [Candidatus Magnetaquiglobus chichijimensis]|uniref:hypothetical protein n=1 Tax=Candidatus Magnetaquiglobus chichijimensis TaxID=3141448 RepID=UPI003B96AEBD